MCHCVHFTVLKLICGGHSHGSFITGAVLGSVPCWRCVFAEDSEIGVRAQEIGVSALVEVRFRQCIRHETPRKAMDGDAGTLRSPRKIGVVNAREIDSEGDIAYTL